MKIGIEVQRLFRQKKFGIETSSLELIKALRDIEPKHEYVVFAKDDTDRECLTASDNVKIKTIGGRMFADFEQFFLPLAVKREQVDLLHCTGNTAPFFCSVPLVQTLHDVIFMDTIPSGDTFYQQFGNLYRRKLVPLVTPRSQAIITVSHYERERIVQRLGIKREKIHVIYNGLNEIHFNRHASQQRRQQVRSKYQLPPEFILFLGNQTTRKNPARVIEAYAKYAAATSSPLPLVTPGLTRGFITHRLSQLDLPFDEERYITPGYIADADLPVLYALSKLFLFPSLSEGFGMPLIEAMACGTPVISSDTSCLPEIAGNAAVLVNPLKADELTAAIVSLSSNDELRRKKIEAGYFNAKRFSWNRAAESVLTIYETVYAVASQKQPRFMHKHVLATRD